MLSRAADEDSLYEIPLSIYLVWMIGCPLSMLGGLFIMVVFLCQRKLRKHPGMHFVFWQALCDFLFSANLVAEAIFHNNINLRIYFVCQLQGFLGQFFTLVHIHTSHIIKRWRSSSNYLVF